MSAASVPLAERRRPPRALRLLSDERLARLVAAGDREAFAVIYDRHHQQLYRYCQSILQSGEDAADALQNTMIKALRALPGEGRHIAVKPWLYRIAHNESISLLRKRRPQEELSEAAGLEGESLERDLAARERLGQLVGDLQELPERQRGALLMRELNGLEYSEIGAVLVTSAASAKQAVYEARMSLQASMEGRETGCDSIRRTLSEHDGRRLRDRRLHAHLRDCGGCRAFEAAISGRQSQLATIAAPLPTAAAAALLQGVFGAVGGAGGGGGGLAGLSAAGAFSALTAKVSVGAATVATVSVGAVAGVGGVAIVKGGGAGGDGRPAAQTKPAPPATPEPRRAQNYPREVEGFGRSAASSPAPARRRGESEAGPSAQPSPGVLPPAGSAPPTHAKPRRGRFGFLRKQSARRGAAKAGKGKAGHRVKARRPRPRSPGKGGRRAFAPPSGAPSPRKPKNFGGGAPKPGPSPGRPDFRSL